LTLLAAGALSWRITTQSGGSPPPATSTSTSTTANTPPPSSTTTSTQPVGSLPQTHALPPAVTPSLTKRMRDLLEAIATGNARFGVPAFFPVQAYVQTKIYSDAAHDWRTRLIPEYSSDIRALHGQIDPNNTPIHLLGYAVDDAASVWVLPGMEFNKGPYWRVYYTVVRYGVGPRSGYFTINTMISWRGEWYISHIANFNS
jgi:hypothetical protein